MQLDKQLCYSYTEGAAAVCKTNILLSGAFPRNAYSNRRPRLFPMFTQRCRLQSQYDNKSRSSGANRLLAPPGIPLLQRKYFVSSLWFSHAMLGVQWTRQAYLLLFFLQAQICFCAKKQLDIKFPLCLSTSRKDKNIEKKGRNTRKKKCNDPKKQDR